MTRAEFDENMNEFPNKFPTIAALKAATWLQVGQVVAVEEYHAGVGGGMLFGRIVAGGTGTDDEGSYIDLAASGLQFKQNFPEIIHTKMFGVGLTDDTTALLNAIIYVDSIGGGTISNAGHQLKLSAITEIRSNITLTGGSAVAIGTGWVGNTANADTETKGLPLFSINNRTDAHIVGMEIDCGITTIDPINQDVAAAGIYINNSDRSDANDNIITHFNGYGLLTKTKNTDAHYESNIVSQWLFGEKGWLDVSARTADGICPHTADGQWVSNVAFYCRYPFHVDNFFNAQFVGNHIYNGSDESADLPVVYIGENCNNSIWTNTYLDNGYVEIRNPRNSFVQSKLTKSAASSHTTAFKVYASAVNDALDGLHITDSHGVYPPNLVTWHEEGGNTFADSIRANICNNIEVGSKTTKSTKGTVTFDVNAASMTDLGGNLRGYSLDLAGSLIKPDAYTVLSVTTEDRETTGTIRTMSTSYRRRSFSDDTIFDFVTLFDTTPSNIRVIIQFNQGQY